MLLDLLAAPGGGTGGQGIHRLEEAAAWQPEAMDVEQQEASWGSLWDSELPEFADLGEVLLSPPPPTQAATASAGGQQARAKRARGRGSGGGRPSLLRSSFRGVAVHPRTGRQALGQAPHPCLCPPPLSLPPCRAPTSLRWACRVEAHVWVAGRQLYGSGFYSQEVAALAYDLLSVRVRGAEAATNFPLELYHAELAAGAQVPLEQLVTHLRAQGKALARIDACQGAAASLEPWELQARGCAAGLSEAISGQPSLGLFACEAEAARAVDRGLLARDGLATAPLLTFPLASYAALLDAATVQQAILQGLLPVTVEAVSAAPPPLPAQQLPGLELAASQNTVLPHIASLPAVSHHAGSGGWEGAAQGGGGGATATAAADGWGMAPPVPQPAVQRKASMTPRASQLG
ncbi:hypothetical protein CHLNCDRAFT_53763 [Chlorella variabilis]|uniref:AP2/ERF domain-containing protein n=1 Tax=Chlorella variabilis TaxID=554065 RepID=E1ZL22_CHLVA|nr:hypothetical protein CHLNCDRAFT_53763 [Chlorella variabilis]EFN53582.1 hypothetical protein CHLNCDRAFT_53763 [Chlorella variabilis]|eukprot:XP_005845684.1 hypothetical protein CHLNCDRAFT_53763 [Chlorella variabilis]